MNRKYYLDNIRSLTVILVLVYHAFYIFNGVGVLSGLNVTDGVVFFDAICTLVYPWFMVLLFCIAGISARHSINKRGKNMFIKERARRLIVPSTLGVLIFHWIIGYLNIVLGGGVEFIPSFLIYPISALSGIGPLWFAQMVFLFSLLVPILFKLEQNERINKLFENIPAYIIILFSVFIFLGAQILNMPVITTYRFGIYGVAFLIGYLFLYFDKVIEKCVKLLIVTLPLSIVFGGIYMWLYFGQNYASDKVLKSPLTNLYLWFAILAIIGIGKKWLDIANGLFEKLNKISFSLYILHYPIAMMCASTLTIYTDVSVFWKGIFVLLAELVVTPMLAYVVWKIPIIRYCLLGIKKEKT